MIALAFDSLFLATLLLLFAMQQQELLVVGSIICAYYAFFRQGVLPVEIDHLLIVLVVALLLLVPTSRLDHGIGPIYYVFSTFFVYYAAKRFAGLPLDHIHKCLKIVFWTSFFGIVFGVAEHWDSAEPMGEIFAGTSTNGLPSYLIVLQVALSVTVFLVQHKLPIGSPVATFIVAVLGLGRGSILVALLIVLFSVFVNYFVIDRNVFNRHFRLALGFVIFGFVFFVSGALHIDGAFDELIEGSKFSAGVLDEHRGYMVRDYLGKIDASSFLFGTDYAGTSILSSYGGNPHNSFIRLHSFYGVGGLLLVLFSIIFLLMANRCRLTTFVTFCLLLFVLIRAVSEPILFPTLLDFFFFFCFFVFVRHAPVRVAGRSALCLKR